MVYRQGGSVWYQSCQTDWLTNWMNSVFTQNKSLWDTRTHLLRISRHGGILVIYLISIYPLPYSIYFWYVFPGPAITKIFKSLNSVLNSNSLNKSAYIWGKNSGLRLSIDLKKVGDGKLGYLSLAFEPVCHISPHKWSSLLKINPRLFPSAGVNL